MRQTFDGRVVVVAEGVRLDAKLDAWHICQQVALQLHPHRAISDPACMEAQARITAAVTLVSSRHKRLGIAEPHSKQPPAASGCFHQTWLNIHGLNPVIWRRNTPPPTSPLSPHTPHSIQLQPGQTGCHLLDCLAGSDGLACGPNPGHRQAQAVPRLALVCFGQLAEFNDSSCDALRVGLGSDAALGIAALPVECDVGTRHV